MNIGETDADGWTYVRFGDAAKAAQEGTHEVQCATQHKYAAWNLLNGEPWINATWRYRIREKTRTVTVTIPRPTDAANGALSMRIILDFSKSSDCDAATKAIRAAMEQS